MLNNEVVLISKGTNKNNKKQAAFVCFYCETEVYKDHEDASFKDKNMKFPLVVFFNRADGKMGFVGGTVLPGESILKALVREVREESGYKMKNTEDLKLICSHETSSLITHLFAQSVTMEQLRTIFKTQYKAKHGFSEGTMFTAHFVNHENVKSFDNFMKNNFALTVKEEISELIAALKWDEKYKIAV